MRSFESKGTVAVLFVFSCLSWFSVSWCVSFLEICSCVFAFLLYVPQVYEATQAAYAKFESKGTFRRFCFDFFNSVQRFCVHMPQA